MLPCFISWKQDKTMARYNANKISYSKQDKLVNLFCRVLSYLKTEQAIQNFLKDLLNRQERIMLIRRLLVAELLIEGRTYREIRNQLHVGQATIARVNRWLYFGRGGYKMAIEMKKIR